MSGGKRNHIVVGFMKLLSIFFFFSFSTSCDVLDR